MVSGSTKLQLNGGTSLDARSKEGDLDVASGCRTVPRSVGGESVRALPADLDLGSTVPAKLTAAHVMDDGADGEAPRTVRVMIAEGELALTVAVAELERGTEMDLDTSPGAGRRRPRSSPDEAEEGVRSLRVLFVNSRLCTSAHSGRDTDVSR